MDRTSILKQLIGVLQYNLGRIVTYGLLGLLTGFIGLSIATLGLLQWASMVIGFSMIIYGWRKQLGKWIPKLDGFHFIPSNSMKFILKNTGRWRLVLLGALNGILPCGMVYLGLINAMLSPTPVIGMFAMIAFGVGTLPVMITIVFMANSISNQVRRRFSVAVPYVLTILGFLIVLRGANLGIPYLSPLVSQKEKQHVHCKTIGATMDCCSNPRVDKHHREE